MSDKEHKDKDADGGKRQFKFSVGDVVRLRSGGQLMTVSEIRGDGGRELIRCVYVDGAGFAETSPVDAAAFVVEASVSSGPTIQGPPVK